MALSAFARNAFTDMPLQQQEMGGGKKIMSMKIFDKELLGFTQNDFFFSMIYLIPFTLSKADILFQQKIPVFFGLFEMGIGRIALVSAALSVASSIYFLQKNKINDQLLSLFPEVGVASKQSNSSSNLSTLMAGMLLLAIAGGMIWWFGKVQHTCPSFSKSLNLSGR